MRSYLLAFTVENIPHILHLTALIPPPRPAMTPQNNREGCQAGKTPDGPCFPESYINHTTC